MPETRASGWPLETPDVGNPATFPEVVDRDVEHPTRVSVNPVATSPAPFVADLGDEGGDGEPGTPIDAALFEAVEAYIDAGDGAARDEAVSTASADATSKADAAKQAAIDDAAAKDAALKGELEGSIASGDASTLSQAAAKVQTAQATLEAMISELRDAKSNIKWVHCAEETYDTTTLKPKAESYPEPDPNALYLVPDPSAQEGNANVEWFWDSEQSDFERFGASVAAPAAISASAIQGLWERGESVTGTDVLNATGYQLTYEQIREWVQREARIQVASQLEGLVPLANGGLGQNLDASNPSLTEAQQAAREALGAASQDAVCGGFAIKLVDGSFPANAKNVHVTPPVVDGYRLLAPVCVGSNGWVGCVYVQYWNAGEVSIWRAGDATKAAGYRIHYLYYKGPAM